MNAVRIVCLLLFATVAMCGSAFAQRTLYIVNSGDAASVGGTITTFSIGPDGELAPTDATGTIGSFLRGIAITPDRRHAYVLDSDTATIIAFAIGDTGLLTQIDAPVQTDPNAQGPFPECIGEAGTGAGPCPFGLAVAPDGRSVYVANAGSDTIAVFRIRPDGTLRLVGSPVPAGGIGPRGVTVSPDGQRVYVSHRDTDTIGVFAVGRNGRLRPHGAPVRVPGCTPSPGPPPRPQCSPMWVAVAPDGRHLYTTNQDSDDLSTFAIGADGGLTPIGERVPTGGRPEGLVITPDQRFLYANSIDANAVQAFAIGADGTLTPLGTFRTCKDERPAACGAIATVMAPDGKHLYAVNVFEEVDHVVSFAILEDGRLEELAGSPMPTGGVDPGFQGLAIR